MIKKFKDDVNSEGTGHTRSHRPISAASEDASSGRRKPKSVTEEEAYKVWR